MSHFKIIQLENEPVNEENGNYINEFDVNDDPLLNMVSDGWEEEDYADTLENIRNFLSVLGKVNKVKKTFRFFKKNKIKELYIQSMESVFENWKNKMEKGQNTKAEYQLRTGVREACGIDDLFYYHGYLHNASCLIADYLAGYIPETMHIGTIFDCHR